MCAVRLSGEKSFEDARRQNDRGRRQGKRDGELPERHVEF